jgi:hypothetical protein
MPYKDKSKRREYMRNYMKQYYKQILQGLKVLQTQFPDVYTLVFGSQLSRQRKRRRKKGGGR